MNARSDIIPDELQATLDEIRQMQEDKELIESPREFAMVVRNCRDPKIWELAEELMVHLKNVAALLYE